MRRRARRAVAAGLGVAALGGLTTGCSRDDAEAGTDPVTTVAASATAPTPSPTTTPGSAAPAPASTPAPRADAVSTSAAPAPTAVPLDALVTLAAALDALAGGYHFATTASIGDTVAISAEGDHIAGSTRMTVASGGTSTEYLVTGAAAWARVDGEWQQLDSAEGLSDPVAQLRDPLAATISGTADAAVVTAEYPNAALGLPGDGTAMVELELAAGRITSLRYASTATVTAADGTVSDQPAVVTAVISPVAPGTEITLPAVDA